MGGKKRSASKKAKKPSAWTRTARKTTCKNGDRKTLYKNSATGKLAVRKFVTRNGKRVASYVSP